MDKWEPIESAPEGKEVLAYSPYSAMGVVIRIRGKWFYLADGGRAIEHQGDFGTIYYEMCAPTHWQPLPEPPEAEG